MQDFDYLQDCRNFYEQRLHSKFDPPVGATEAEISVLQAKLDADLPIAYRQFLLWMGKDKHGALKGSEWFIDEVCENGDFLDEFLVENEVKRPEPNSTVCFFVTKVTWQRGSQKLIRNPIHHVSSILRLTQTLFQLTWVRSVHFY